MDNTAIKTDSVTRVVIDIPPPSDAASAETQASSIADFEAGNYFALRDGSSGPYTLYLQWNDDRLLLNLQPLDNTSTPAPIAVSLRGLSRLIKDYQDICHQLQGAAASLPPDRCETLDMVRRTLHNEAASILQKQLAAQAETDLATARRLFTIICTVSRGGVHNMV